MTSTRSKPFQFPLTEAERAELIEDVVTRLREIMIDPKASERERRKVHRLLRQYEEARKANAR